MRAEGHSTVLLSGSVPEDSEGEVMRFRLTYEGPIRATQRDPEHGQRNPLGPHKHDIRRVFHGQLKHLWATNRFLKETKMSELMYREWLMAEAPQSGKSWTDNQLPLHELIANMYKEYGYRFVPLVRDYWHLSCSLRILFLRRDAPGSVITAGDIDNRIKTIIDALRRPRNGNELVGNEAPRRDEDPFFCLLEDDRQVTHLEVETDTLLDPPTNEQADSARAKLLITVDLKPYHVDMFNMSFSGS